MPVENDSHASFKEEKTTSFANNSVSKSSPYQNKNTNQSNPKKKSANRINGSNYVNNSYSNSNSRQSSINIQFSSLYE